MCENGVENGVRKIHDETDSFVALLEDNDLIDEYALCTPDVAKSRCESIANLTNGEVEFDGKTTGFTIPSCHGGIPVTVYTPRELGMKPAIVVHFHGGSLTWTSRATATSICRHTARCASCIVVSVDYRNAPEHKLLDSLNDAVGVVRWVVFNKGLLGAKHNSSVGVMGESGGGLIAAQVAHELAAIEFQILIYPKLDLHAEGDSYKDGDNDGPLCTRADVNRFISGATDDDTSPKSLQRCNPGHKENCSKLPPALFVVAEYDPVKDDAHNYMKKLKESKVKTNVVTVKGTYHGFFHFPGHFKLCSAKAMDRVSDFIRSHSDYNHLQLLS